MCSLYLASVFFVFACVNRSKLFHVDSVSNVHDCERTICGKNEQRENDADCQLPYIFVYKIAMKI